MLTPFTIYRSHGPEPRLYHTYDSQHVIALFDISKVKGGVALVLVDRIVHAWRRDYVRGWIGIGRGDIVAATNGGHGSVVV